VVTDLPNESTGVVTDRPAGSTSVVTDLPNESTGVVTDRPAGSTSVVTDLPNEPTGVVKDQPTEPTGVVTNQPIAPDGSTGEASKRPNAPPAAVAAQPSTTGPTRRSGPVVDSMIGTVWADFVPVSPEGIVNIRQSHELIRVGGSWSNEIVGVIVQDCRCLVGLPESWPSAATRIELVDLAVLTGLPPTWPQRLQHLKLKGLQGLEEWPYGRLSGLAQLESLEIGAGVPISQYWMFLRALPPKVQSVSLFVGQGLRALLSVTKGMPPKGLQPLLGRILSSCKCIRFQDPDDSYPPLAHYKFESFTYRKDGGDHVFERQVA
jgi:hypothetical protein